MLNEKKLSKSELEKREDIIMKMKNNKRSLVKKYGKDAEAVMYGRATNMAKKQSESMKSDRLNELIKDSLSPSKELKSYDMSKHTHSKSLQSLPPKPKTIDLDKHMPVKENEKIVKGKDGDDYKKHDITNLKEMDPVSWDLQNGAEAQWVPDKVGHSADGDLRDDPSDGYDTNYKDTIDESKEVRDIKGNALEIGDVVKSPDNNLHQIIFSYAEDLPFLSPWNGRKPNLSERIYFKDKLDMRNTLEKIKDYSQTRGGFIK